MLPGSQSITKTKKKTLKSFSSTANTRVLLVLIAKAHGLLHALDAVLVEELCEDGCEKAKVVREGVLDLGRQRLEQHRRAKRFLEKLHHGGAE